MKFHNQILFPLCKMGRVQTTWNFLCNFDPLPLCRHFYLIAVIIKCCGHLSNPFPPSFVHVVCTRTQSVSYLQRTLFSGRNCTSSQKDSRYCTEFFCRNKTISSVRKHCFRWSFKAKMQPVVQAAIIHQAKLYINSVWSTNPILFHWKNATRKRTKFE